MSYQVLARKWRPKTFQEMAGQAHVLRALENAMSQGRLHHAYLFTGTRGVGKTTVARILAKCFNCEEGVSATPCGVCSACVEIDQGRSLDLIEVDAASRTRVEDTRELLDNVQYAPARARFKIYLIDEVHMLSTHSFNALLKTLEEPPEHVKFLLATTDPQKLPVTVLSRCLQFSLKNMTPQRIVSHLQTVLAQEQVDFEEEALWEVSRAADGSMRDALSLTDQAIAFGGGRLTANDVQAMLGTIDRQRVLNLASFIIRQDLPVALNEVRQLAEQGSDLQQVLKDLGLIFHRIAMAQVVPDAIDNAMGDKSSIVALANVATTEAVQLYYQQALMGIKDLQWAPDVKAGLEMVVMRMVMFVPIEFVDAIDITDGEADVVNVVERHSQKPRTQQEVQDQDPQAQQSQHDHARDQGEPVQMESVREQPLESREQSLAEKKSDYNEHGSLDSRNSVRSVVQTVDKPMPLREQPSAPPVVETPIVESKEEVIEPPEDEKSQLKRWMKVIQSLGVEGVAYHLAKSSCLLFLDDQRVVIKISPQSEAMRTESAVNRLESLLRDKLRAPVKLQVEIGELDEETPLQYEARQKQIRLDAMEKQLSSEPIVQGLMETFGAQLHKESIELID